jgi:hypothetical protein
MLLAQPSHLADSARFAPILHAVSARSTPIPLDIRDAPSGISLAAKVFGKEVLNDRKKEKRNMAQNGNHHLGRGFACAQYNPRLFVVYQRCLLVYEFLFRKIPI